jgi:hypothetical protein
VGYDVSQRAISPGVINHDHVSSIGFSWGGKTLFQQGYIAENAGSQDGQPYNFAQVGQGVLVTRPFSLSLSYNRQWLGPTATDQGIITGTYRLTSDRALGARVVYQSGSTDVYVSFSQQARSGADYFVIFGDPNSTKTRGLLTFKVVMPF